MNKRDRQAIIDIGSNSIRLVVFGGGLPIRAGGVLIGGIGVSGASEAQDEECARAALDAIGAE